uniref:Putative rhipicephalus specific protein n=4 Tax=Ixodidae TaxID=6939 RepID=L7M9E0_RHIPC
MLLTRRCEILLQAVVVATILICEAAPPMSPALHANVKGSTTPGTALMVLPSEAPLVPEGGGNTTSTNETTHEAHNETTLAPASGNVTAKSNVSNTTEHGGDAVLHYGVGTESEVVKKPQPHKYFFTSWITWREDNYLMSILIPIACGVAAAVLILCSLACIGCCRRRCRSRNRRKLHRKIDPKTFRKMKAADRIKLLAASSDEEF